ncbi:MAG TPA: cytochrome d ubiquinol oxidase subunit II [Roseiflexaceae bacterium]|nr:cytochrome d ubiquinol oxidase subunit II [Roseiflexaceae bacterium]
MPSLEVIVAGLMLVALTFYALLGGADFGGGLWDLLARGPRASKQRALIADAIGPIWEANHVWLILVVVIMFSAFPLAFAVIMTALHIPLTLMLIGIVLRGAAFTFRTYDAQHDRVQRRWSQVFAIASVVTPIMLGICVGAIASGRITVENEIVTSGFFESWMAPFPLAVGGFALALFAFLAAVYLTVEAREPELREDFRRRALAAAVGVGAMALLVFLLAGAGAPRIRAGLSASLWAWPLQIATGLAAVGAIWALWTRRFYLARALAAAQVSLILWGWGAAQFPYLVEPDITIQDAAAPEITLRLLLIALGVGALLLFPSVYVLFRIFKGPDVFRVQVEPVKEQTKPEGQ